MVRSARLRLAALALVGVFAAACRDPNVRRTLPPDIRIDSYAQQNASKVDVLWVVDNSGSMAPRQENLAKNFQAFIDLFAKGAIDYRLAVTTTDIFKDQGQLKGTPKIITPTTGNPAAAFAANVKVGTSGSPFEAGLEAAQMALEKQAMANGPKTADLAACLAPCGASGTPEVCAATCNARYPIDFLRPDAYLYLIFVSDEEDRSSQDVRYYWRSFETAKGVGNDGTVTTAAIMGEDRNACGARVGQRYIDLSALTGGEVGSICDDNFANTLRKLATSAVGLKRKFTVSKPPNVETLKVVLRYPCGAAPEVTASCASVDAAFCDGKPKDAVALECTPKQGAPDGWTYEPKDRLIYFAGESVPGLNAQIDIEYYEEGKGP